MMKADTQSEAWKIKPSNTKKKNIFFLLLLYTTCCPLCDGIEWWELRVILFNHLDDLFQPPLLYNKKDNAVAILYTSAYVVFISPLSSRSCCPPGPAHHHFHSFFFKIYFKGGVDLLKLFVFFLFWNFEMISHSRGEYDQLLDRDQLLIVHRIQTQSCNRMLYYIGCGYIIQTAALF